MLLCIILLLIGQGAALLMTWLLYKIQKSVMKTEGFRHANNMELFGAIEQLLEKQREEAGRIFLQGSSGLVSKPQEVAPEKKKNRVGRGAALREYWRKRREAEKVLGLPLKKRRFSIKKETVDPPTVPIKIVD